MWGWVCVCSLHSWLPLVLLGCCSGILPGQGRPRVAGVGLSPPEPQLFSHHVPAEGRYWPRWNSACAPGWVEPHLAEIFSVTKSWAGAPTLPLWEERTEKVAPCCSPDRALGCRGVPGQGRQAHLRMNCFARAPPGPQSPHCWASVWPSY